MEIFAQQPSVALIKFTTANMDWPSVEEIESIVRMPRGYRLELLNPDDVNHFIESLTEWYPDIQAGCESRFLRIDFYKTTLLPFGVPPRKRFFLPIVFRHESSRELAGCIFLEKNDSALTITAPLGVIATNHRHNHRLPIERKAEA